MPKRNMKSTRGPKFMAAAMASAVEVKKSLPAETTEPQTAVSRTAFARAIRRWPDNPRKAVNDLEQKYGLPQEATPIRVTWYLNGPWKYTTVSRFEINHNFPSPHTDYIKQAINYRVPVEKMCDVAAFNSSIIVDRSAGEVAFRCEGEVWSFIALNLMHDIVVGKLAAKQARQAYTEIASAFKKNRPVPYAEKLQFEVPLGDTADPDTHKI